jgi:hypothetical protein
MKKTWIGKRRFTRWVLAIMLVSAGASFGAGTRVSLQVKDKVKSDTKSFDEFKNFSSGDGGEWTLSTDKETEICTLTVMMKLRGEPSRDCQLEWAFISECLKKIGDDEARVVFCTGKKKISLQENVKLENTIVSDPFIFTTSTQSGVSNPTDRTSGDVYEGYVVLLTSNGEILAMDASSKRYEQDEWIEKVRNFEPAPAKKKRNR